MLGSIIDRPYGRFDFSETLLWLAVVSRAHRPGRCLRRRVTLVGGLGWRRGPGGGGALRVGVSGTHGTGKSTLVDELCARLAGHVPAGEPYVLLEEEGYEFEFPPAADDFRALVRRSTQMLSSPGPRVVFDRTPLDYLAYLIAMDADFEVEAG